MKHARRYLLAAIGGAFACMTGANALAGTRTFTVADEVELADFGDPSYGGKVEPITLSPDGTLAAVHAGRGLLKENASQSELRIYDLRALKGFVNGGDTASPEPLWSIRLPSHEGPAISQVRWTADSRAVAFLRRSGTGSEDLLFAEIGSRTLSTLSAKDQDVLSFDVEDRTHYVYVIRDPEVMRSARRDRDAVSIPATGRPLYDFIFPVDVDRTLLTLNDRGLLWAATGGASRPVRNPTTGRPVAVYAEGQNNLVISPDGKRAVTAVLIDRVDPDWTTRFAMPRQNYPRSIVPGIQNTEGPASGLSLSQYAIVDLATGAITIPANAPTGASNGWHTYASPAWSADGKWLLLPTMFLPDGAPGAVRPCVAIVSVGTNETHCLERLKNKYSETGPEPGFYRFYGMNFEGEPARRAILEYQHLDESKGYRVYAPSRGRWHFQANRAADAIHGLALKLQVAQSLNDSPKLVATDVRSGRSRVVWDPNPQLNEFAFGETTVYRWKDTAGRDRIGGLYKPPGFRAGMRYPLVIQPHGFNERYYRPSGLFPSVLAARALASAGMVVLQVLDCDYTSTPEEAPCQISGYEGAVKALAANAIIDEQNVGIIGFSRTCYYVLQALSRSTIPFSAAIVADGVNEGYWQYLETVDFRGNGIAREANPINGGAPFADGLLEWFRNSPMFNMHRVTAPVQVVAQGSHSLLFMWEAYATLRYLKKPVDLVLLNTGEHVLTNPAVRVAAQGGTVDWMRFWLQGYEDPAPEKADQYRRWEKLCELQVAAVPGRATHCVSAAR